MRSSKHIVEEVEAALARFEQWAESIDPEEFEDIGDLRTVAKAADALRHDEVRLREAVELARGQGRSWNRIAIALGVSRQAARQRFAEKVRT